MPLRAQSLLSTLLGEGQGVSLNTGVINIGLLGKMPESNSGLSIGALTDKGLLSVGFSGQDILLLGAPASGGLSLPSIMPLLNIADPSQPSVIEFLEGSVLSGDLEPTVLTISLPGVSISNDAPSKTVDTRQDQNDGETAETTSFSPILLAKNCEDRDNDSVCDTLDQCPDSPAEAIVLPSGCHFDLNKPLELQGVEFAVDTALLTASSTHILEQAAQILQKWPKRHIEVAGHTDDTGDQTYNRNLSLQRAETVRRFLIDEGVAPARLIANGYGASDPKVNVVGLKSEKLKSARAKNRRVELRLIEQQPK